MLSFNSMSALSADRESSANQRTAIERIATMRRINSATDDAAGSAIADRLAAALRSSTVAVQTMEDGQSLAETADGALSQTTEHLQRMRELAQQAGNGTYTDRDREALNREYRQMAAEVERTLASTRFNGEAVLAGDAGSTPLPAGPGPTDTITVDTQNLQQNAQVMAATAGTLSGPQAGPSHAAQMTKALDAALKTVSELRATLGAAQSRLSSAASSLQQQVAASSSSYERLTGSNMAAEVSRMHSAQTAQYAAVSMLAQSTQHRRNLLMLVA